MKKLFPFIILFVFACKQRDYNADLLIKNATIYTVDNKFSMANAVIVKNGKIIAVGDADTLERKYQAKSVIDAGNKALYPGFIDAHAHFYEYGLGLQEAKLEKTSSWQEVIDSIVIYSRKYADGWLVGRGWNQNKWKVRQFPDKAKLDSLFPIRPVVLSRIDGHAIIANQAALNIAGITTKSNINGGKIETINGKLTGVLIDNAQDLVFKKIPPPADTAIQAALLGAQSNSVAVGLTTVDDCGLSYTMINTINELQHKGALKMRLYVMLSDEQSNYDYLFKHGVFKTPGLHVGAFKLYADGALGSRGACLLQPYADQKGWSGFLLSKQEHFKEIAQKLVDKGFQMCTHAIGDSANRIMLKIYASVLKGKNDRRWRIEHAQIVSPQDVSYFGDYNIIPSVQPTHATSDMYWAGDRLGKKRLKTAYIYKQLLNQNGWIPLGTDFPVENINPLYTFYAAVARKDLKNYPTGGFQTENALSRKQALMGITTWAAKANFEENEKGSIKVGSYADFVILDKDIMKIDAQEIPTVKVLKTYINGNLVYEKK